MGNYILYHQQLHGWGSKIIKQPAKAIRLNFPEKKGYSERNLTYMCQFARTYPLRVLRSFIDTDVRLSVPNIQNVTNEVLKLNDKQFTQELTAQIQSVDCQSLEFTQEPLAQIHDVAKTEWYGSHVVTTTTNEGVEGTHTAILGFIFSEDGTSCIVETGIETLISTNRVTKYVNYSPLTHSVTLTESSNSSMTEYLGVIDDESMLVQHCVDGKLSNEVIKLFKKK